MTHSDSQIQTHADRNTQEDVWHGTEGEAQVDGGGHGESEAAVEGEGSDHERQGLDGIWKSESVVEPVEYEEEEEVEVEDNLDKFACKKENNHQVI